MSGMIDFFAIIVTILASITSIVDSITVAISSKIFFIFLLEIKMLPVITTINPIINTILFAIILTIVTIVDGFI